MSRPCECNHKLEAHDASLVDPECWQWPVENLCGECSCEGYIEMKNLNWLEWLLE